MPLVAMNEVLKPAREGTYAVGAFNACNLELAKLAIEAAEETGTPVIIACHPNEIAYAGIKPLSQMMKALAEDCSVPVVLHLDHGDSYETVINCLRHGFTSVMIDGSLLPYEDNVQQTKKVVEAAKAVGVSVEAELGCIGGQELDIVSDPSKLTDPEMAADFVTRTRIDSLAVAIGTVHGLYQGEPKIDLDRLREIRERVDVPLVLHGGSDTPAAIIKEAIQLGINKINISTEFKMAYREAVLDFMNNDKQHEPLVINRVGMDAAKKVVNGKFKLFGSLGKAR